MPTPPIAFALSEDCKQLICTPTVGPFAMSAQTVEGLIRALISWRTAMEPRRTPTDPIAGTPAITAPDMRWWIGRSTMPNAAVQLMLSHPGLGWIGMELDRETAEQLIDVVREVLTET